MSTTIHNQLNIL